MTTETAIDLFKKLGEYKDGKTRLVCVNEFVGDFVALKLGNGGSWCRMDSKLGKTYKLATYNGNGEYRYSWKDGDDDEKARFEESVRMRLDEQMPKGNRILFIQLLGVQDDLPINRSIRSDIKDALEGLPCVVCGTHKTEIDHKNGLYNNPRVLDITTQCIEDFQMLCRHCNAQKRYTIQWSRKTGKRYPASLIPQLAGFPDYIAGDETFDENDPNAMVGTYWYDPVAFLSTVT